MSSICRLLLCAFLFDTFRMLIIENLFCRNFFSLFVVVIPIYLIDLASLDEKRNLIYEMWYEIDAKGTRTVIRSIHFISINWQNDCIDSMAKSNSNSFQNENESFFFDDFSIPLTSMKMGEKRQLTNFLTEIAIFPLLFIFVNYGLKA